jgi:hypothetical protein
MAQVLTVSPTARESSLPFIPVMRCTDAHLLWCLISSRCLMCDCDDTHPRYAPPTYKAHGCNQSYCSEQSQYVCTLLPVFTAGVWILLPLCLFFVPNQFHRSAHAPAHTERQAFVVSMMKIAGALHMAVAVQQQFLLADTGHSTVDDEAVCWAKCSNGSMQPSRSQLLQPPAQSKSDLG